MDVNVVLDVLTTINTQAPQLLEMYKHQLYLLIGFSSFLIVIGLFLLVFVYIRTKKIAKEHGFSCLQEIIIDYYLGRVILAFICLFLGTIFLISGVHDLHTLNLFPQEFLIDKLFS